MTLEECLNYIQNEKYDVKKDLDIDFIDSSYNYLCDYKRMVEERENENNRWKLIKESQNKNK